MKPRLPPVPAAAWTALLALLAAWLLTWTSSGLATTADADDDLAGRSRALQRAHQAVLGLQVIALDGARSNATLGRVRRGSGVLIGADGVVLTIGYLVLEAEQVQLALGDGRSIPARVLGYDVATGFGLVQALAPLAIEPVALGSAASASLGGGGAYQQPLMVASGGDNSQVSTAQLVSRRAFSGYWEYHIEGALFTTPPRRDHSGAGLFNARGELVGIGSLLVADAAGVADGDAQSRQSGNMFVPVDLLLPILDDLRQRGSSAASRRAWLGMNCVEQSGSLRVVRVSDDSPADVAGLLPGDRILRIDGTEVRALATLWQTLWAGGAPEREVVLEIERDQQTQTLKVYSVDRMKTLRRAEGI